MKRSARTLALLASAACGSVSGSNPAIPPPIDVGGPDASPDTGAAATPPDPTCTTDGCLRSATRRDDVGVVVDYEIVAGGTHTDVAFGPVTVAERRTLDSIAWVRERLEAP